jgi:hypothetical protein
MDAPLLTDDFREFLSLLNAHGVEYLLVGGYAVALHGYPRATIDLDVWLRATPAQRRASPRGDQGLRPGTAAVHRAGAASRSRHATRARSVTTSVASRCR